MSKILITGNGFDLFHGLPTKYGHFMVVMKSIEDLKIDGEINFKSLFNENFQKQYHSDYILLLENYEIENIVFEEQKIKKLFEKINENLWYRYFKTVIEIETWIDFEIEIEKVLNQFISFFSYIEDEHKLTHGIKLTEVPINEEFISLGIIENESRNLFRVKKSFLSQKQNKIDEGKILRALSDSLHEFKNIFNRYLEDIVYKLYRFQKVKFDLPFDRISEIYTFNYSPSVEMFYNVNQDRVTYVHGRSNVEDEKQNIVLGINDIEEQIKNHKMYDFTKYYQKIIGNSNHKFIKTPEVKTNTLNENIFYIIGHSLDKSDKKYISEIFKFLEFDLKKKSKICVFYYNKADYETKLKNLFSIIDENLIIKYNSDNRLYFIELNNQNICNEFNRLIYKDYSGEMRISVK